MANHTPFIDERSCDREKGCTTFKRKTKKKWTSLLKAEVKGLEKEVKVLERGGTLQTEGLLKLRKEQLKRRSDLLERRIAHDIAHEPTEVYVYEAEVLYDVEYPVLERGYEVEGCNHDWSNHTCACYKHLGQVTHTRSFSATMIGLCLGVHGLLRTNIRRAPCRVRCEEMERFG